MAFQPQPRDGGEINVLAVKGDDCRGGSSVHSHGTQLRRHLANTKRFLVSQSFCSDIIRRRPPEASDQCVSLLGRYRDNRARTSKPTSQQATGPVECEVRLGCYNGQCRGVLLIVGREEIDAVEI